MAFTRSATRYYLKGTSEAWFMNPSSGDLDYYTNKLTTSKITSSVNMGEITAGLGNAVAINIPDSGKLSVELTAADFALEPRQLSVGGTLAYNGIQPILESITASSATLTVTNTPCAMYGFGTAICYIDNSGTAYEVDTNTKVVQDFTATSGTTYCVRYFRQNASAQELTIWANFSPSVEIMYIKTAIYSASGSDSASGSRVGWQYMWIPRCQFSGDIGTEASPTTNATTSLAGSALSYDPSSNSTVCSDDDTSVLGYFVRVLDGDVTALVEDLVFVGVGSGISLASGSTYVVPAKYVINDRLTQPDLSDITWTTSAATYATVSNGVVTGVAAGSATITGSITVGSSTFSDTVVMSIT